MSKETIELLTRDPLHIVLDDCSDKDVLALGCTSRFFKTKVNDHQLWVRRAKNAQIEFLPDDSLEAKLYYLAIRRMQRCRQDIPQAQFEVVLKNKDHPFTMRKLVHYYMNYSIPKINACFNEGVIFEPYRALEIATDLANKQGDIRGILFLLDCCVNNNIMVTNTPKNQEMLEEWPMTLMNLAFKISGQDEPNIPLNEDTRKKYKVISKECFYKFFQQHSFEELLQFSQVLELISPHIIDPDKCLVHLAENYTLQEISDSISFLFAPVMVQGRFIDLLSVGSLEEIRDINEEIKVDIKLHGYYRVIKHYRNPAELMHCTDYLGIN